MWKWLLVTGLTVTAFLQGISGTPVVEDDEAGHEPHRALRYVFDNLLQGHLQSVDESADERILSKRKASRPEITSTAEDFTVEKGEDVTLPCNVNNPGRNYVIWKKDGSDILKVKKMGTIGNRWTIPRRYRENIDKGHMSLDKTTLTLHNVDMDFQGTYLCTVNGEDTQVEHTLNIQDLSSVVTTAAPSDSEVDYYDYDYYESYEDLFGKDEEVESDNKDDKEDDKDDKEDDKSSAPSADVEENIKEVQLQAPSNEQDPSENEDDYYDYDYYEDSEEDLEKDETTPEPTETTTETPTEAPTTKPTEPARKWGWSFFRSKPKTTVQVTTTTTTEIPTIPEGVTEDDDDEYTYNYDDYEEYEENGADIFDDKDTGEEETTAEASQDKNDFIDEEETTAEASQVAVGKDGMACLACTLSLDDDNEQKHVDWMHDNMIITPDGESIVALQDGDMYTLLLTEVKREDLGEYRCIIGKDEEVFNLVAFPTKPVYKMVDKNSNGNYQITWEAKGLVSIDSYSITYRQRDSPSEWWQQEGPFEVSPSSDDTYSHTFHNLQPYTDYEAIVSTIFQDMATTGDPYPFSVKRTGDMYPSSRKPGNGLARAWMKQPVDTTKNQALELVCMMDTKRRTKVQWFHGPDYEVPVKDDNRITSYQKGKKNILKFTSVEPSDLGEYRCQGQTPSGIKEATVQLVAFPPSANNQEVTELNSGTYKLSWESKGLAPVTSFSITYRKSDSSSEGWHQIGPIQVKDSESTDDKYSYVFTNLQPSSSYDVIVSTIYRDLATTGEPFSFTTKDTSSVVISEADTNNMGKARVWIEQSVVHVDMDKPAELVCVVDEQQDIQVEWYHGQQKIATDNQRLIRTEDNKSILEFTSISTKDLGTYQCIVYNKFGQTNAFALLTTADVAAITPPRGVLKSEDVTQWWSLTQAIFSDVHKYLKTLTRIPQPTELVY